MNEPPDGAASRTEAIVLLSRSCGLLLLKPDDMDVRAGLAVVLATTPLTSSERDSLLTRALVEEASAHGEELAFRLEAPGYSSLYVAATTAKLHQTLSVLQLQLGANAGRTELQLFAV